MVSAPGFAWHGTLASLHFKAISQLLAVTSCLCKARSGRRDGALMGRPIPAHGSQHSLDDEALH
jgi:hypothetical protein